MIRPGNIFSGPFLPEPIQVKGGAGVGEVNVTTNEYRPAARLEDEYWLCVVFDSASTPELRAVRHPVKLAWQSIVAIEYFRIDSDAVQVVAARPQSTQMSRHNGYVDTAAATGEHHT